MCVQKSLSFFVPLLVLSSITSAQNICAKIDFDRATFYEFRACNQRQPLVIKEYSTNNLPKYRSSSRYFLGTNFNEFACIESSARFSLNTNSYIEAPVYFRSAPGAFVEIIVYDMDRNTPVYSWRNSDGRGTWSMAHIDIRSPVPNAQIVIQASINTQSFVALEYIHILNKLINTPDCMNGAVPGQGPPGQWTPTRPPGQQGPPGWPGSTPWPHYPTTPHRPNASNNSNNIILNELLVAIIVLTSISVILIILTGLFYCFVGNRPKSSHEYNK